MPDLKGTIYCQSLVMKMNYNQYTKEEGMKDFHKISCRTVQRT